jgi:hypothetical protein
MSTVKMENLRDLKDVITVVYARMITENPMRSDLASYLVDMTKKSLLTFTSGYVDFEKLIGGETDLYAHWMNTQLQVMTLLDGDDALLVRHTRTVYETLLGTTGGPAADVFPKDFDYAKKRELPNPSRSVMIALAFRVFLDNIEIVAAPPGTPNPPPQPKA